MTRVLNNACRDVLNLTRHYMDNTALRYFLEVAHSGSLSKASERLYVAISALSRQIAKLEEQLGTPLFERHPRGMVLSDAGQMLVEHARRSLLETERVIEEIRGLSEAASTTIRIASSEGVAPHFLPQVFAHFQVTYPSTRFQLDVCTPTEATQQVREGGADICVCFSIAPEKGIDIHYSQRAPIYALVRCGHALATRESVSLLDLMSWPLAMHNRSMTVWRLLDIACGLEKLSFEPTFVSNYHTALQSYVRLTDAVTLTSYLTVRSRLDMDELAIVPITNPEMNQRTLQVQTMTGRILSQKMRAFLELLIRAIEEPATVDW